MATSGKSKKEPARQRQTVGPQAAALIILAKAPIPGQVKTRLCPPLAPDEAATLHGTMVLDTLERSRNLLGFDRFLACAPSKQHPFFKAVGARQDVHLLEQVQGDLGRRMHQAFSSVFDLGYRSAVAVGTDLPTVHADMFRQALKGLADHDVVLGPSVDGGYYLIGLNNPALELFSDIPWSTDQVFTSTRQKAQHLNLSVQLLTEQRDLDTLTDLQFFIKETQGPGKKLISSRTAQVLKTLANRLGTRD
jgi:rSAM/selenodomain-associated transferase 1